MLYRQFKMTSINKSPNIVLTNKSTCTVCTVEGRTIKIHYGVYTW